MNSNDDALAGAASGKEATGGESLTTFRGVTVLDDEAFLGGISLHRAKVSVLQTSQKWNIWSFLPLFYLPLLRLIYDKRFQLMILAVLTMLGGPVILVRGP